MNQKMEPTNSADAPRHRVPRPNAESPGKASKELTAREIEILRLIAEGFQGKEIAAKLAVTPKTVEFHKTKLYARIGAKGIADAVRFAIREGYLADG